MTSPISFRSNFLETTWWARIFETCVSDKRISDIYFWNCDSIVAYQETELSDPSWILDESRKNLFIRILQIGADVAK